jgi:arylsulfatase A-like enzyme
VEYTDWAIGSFLREAGSRPWFRDTVFAIVADHCHSSAGRTEVPVRKYHIPLLIFSPGHVEAGRVDKLASQIDVAPTLLGLLGFSYRSHFFGHDLLQASGVEPRAFLATYQRLGLLERDTLTVLSPRRQVEAYRVDLGRGREVEVAPQSDLVADAVAYYESASLVWRHGLLREGVAAGTIQ